MLSQLFHVPIGRLFFLHVLVLLTWNNCFLVIPYRVLVYTMMHTTVVETAIADFIFVILFLGVANKLVTDKIY